MGSPSMAPPPAMGAPGDMIPPMGAPTGAGVPDLGAASLPDDLVDGSFDEGVADAVDDIRPSQDGPPMPPPPS
ncbi:MAG: hypothetical protein ACI8TP_004362 [Acidimicrobiales bacterium]|jgi:hypothetical protein